MSENTGNSIAAIGHIDGDAFFASCEQAREPSLKGKPLVTGKERGIISCASYEAKALGIKRGVMLREARKICPSLIILPSDYELYSIISERMMSIVRKFTPQVEEFSIDEVFFDLTGLRRLYRKSYDEIALDIKKAIVGELGISISMGVSITKILAKLASEENKPDGFTYVPAHELHKFLGRLELGSVCGFGPNTVALLQKNGVRTPLDYIERPIKFAEKLLGKVGVELWQELSGIPIYKVTDEKKDKFLSITKSKTFSPPSKDKEFVWAQLVRNLESAFIKLRRHKLSVKKLVVFLRASDFRSCGMEAGINRHSVSAVDFMDVSRKMFEGLFKMGQEYRATGVILMDIKPEGSDNRDLFEDPIKIESMERIAYAMDEVNHIYGKHTVHLAASNAVGKPRSIPMPKPRICGIERGTHSRNDPTWRKKDLLPGETFRKRINIPLMKIDLKGNK